MVRLFRVFIPVATLTLLVSEVILITAAFVATTYLSDFDPKIYLMYQGGLLRILLVTACFLAGLYFQDLYSRVHIDSRIRLAQQLCLVGGTALLLQGTVSYLNWNLRLPLPVMIVGSALSLTLVFCWRTLFSAYALRVVGNDRLLMVGDSGLLESIGAHVGEHPEKGLVITGYVREDGGGEHASPGGKVLGSVDALRDIVAAVKPRRIVVGMAERRGRVPIDELLELRLSGYVVEEAAAAFERVCGRIAIRELRPSQLIYSGELGPKPQDVFYQRFWNALLAAVGIVAAAPIMLLTALAIRLTSRGPALYRQRRIGLKNAPFTLYKFRSMRVDAEARSGPVWASKNDPRVTKVGRIIRKLRIDELPQLFNVLKGEMSIVRPRPERPEFVRELSARIPFYPHRHFVRPGITGWAQINYKYGDTIEDAIAKLEYDLYYIKNMSSSLDAYIIFHTIKAMLLSRGAQ